MRILIVTSCTGEKKVRPSDQLTLEDFQQGADHVRVREHDLAELLTPAEDLYTGMQHVRLMLGVRALREARPVDVVPDLRIVSAGYGLIEGSRKIAPYEATFTDMKKGELRAWGEELGLPSRIRSLLAEPYDLALVLLGDSYLEACRLSDDVTLGGPTLLFCGRGAAAKLPQLDSLRTVEVGNAEARRFSCGLVGLKGELAARVLQKVAEDPVAALRLFAGETDVLGPLDNRKASNILGEGAKPKKSKARANPKVDHVIQIPDSWYGKPHRSRLRYFIPEWDDLVDPDYDFENDVHSGGSGDWANEVYAHQMYREPNYDGILISKVVAEKSKKKKERINTLGVHRFLRVPRNFPIMGDCGAFGYIKQDVPPYSTDEILDYYTRLDFDLGVSIDHLIVTATQVQKKERYELTINNAEEFLREHRKRELAWTPIGAVQGWDPKSYAEAARQYVAMGYKYIALGGLVRTSTPEVLAVLEEVHKVVPEDVAIHLFGLARLNAIRDFAKLGVRSVDSASLLRRAWMGTGQNYLTATGEMYAAIRIPAADKSFRAKHMVRDGRASLEEVQRLEAACIRAMHEFDRGRRNVTDTVDVLMEYDHLITPDRTDNRRLLERTLEAAPWKNCDCEICRRDGIDVIIFRGNNRNRRRGFHNTYVFYRLVQRALQGENIRLGGTAVSEERERQPDLFVPKEASGA